MLSILIPVYNYNIVTLVDDIHKKATDCAIDFEIICQDDHSKNLISESNSTVKTLSDTHYYYSEINNGRNVTRQLLCDKAKYDWLLFLDADVLPKNNDFISHYLTYLKYNYEAIYGGFAYDKQVPETHLKLRWEYGRKREEISAVKRNKRPYKAIISANFLIKKSVFKMLNQQITGNLYGEDNHFGALLKTHNIAVKHIDNEVYHLGIEPSANYLEKKEHAAITLLNLYNSNKKMDHDNDLLHLFKWSKRFGLNHLWSLLFKLTKPLLRNNLLGNNPSVKLLQIYKIGFMCYWDLKS